MMLLMAKMQLHQKKAAEAAEVNNAGNLRDLVESEDLTPEALQARKDADEADTERNHGSLPASTSNGPAKLG